MAQLGEAVSIATIDVSRHKEATCPFCSEDETESIDNKLNNDASELRKSCHTADVLGMPEPCTDAPGSEEWNVVYKHPETQKDEISQVRSNPHHCIPGNASLNGEYQHPILEAIDKDKGTITGNIGYDVNKQANGIWLPTIIEHFYGGYKNVDPVAGISWGKLTTKYPREQFSMAEAAMFETRRQFHDAHQDYSDHVKMRLSKIMDKLIQRKICCPDAGPKAKPDVPPPFGLVNWMDGVSRGMAGFLSCVPERWRDPIWTSRHAEEFHEKLSGASD